MMVRKNSMKAVAPTRGVISFLVGSVPRARMASICSVTIIEPSSLAMPEALRPATISPVMSGPSSVTMPSETSWPMSVTPPNRCNVLAEFSASSAPTESPVRITMGREPTPIRSACCSMSPMYSGRRKKFASDCADSRVYS